MGREVQGELTFFPVSTKKFTILSTATFGIYPIYWFYQNWKRIRAGGERVSPLWRAGLAPFYGVALLNRIKQRAEKAPVEVTWSPVSLGIAFLVVSLLAFLPGSWSLLSVGLFVPLLPPIQTMRQINAAAGNPEGVNGSFGTGNIVTIVTGALVWALLLFAMAVQP